MTNTGTTTYPGTLDAWVLIGTADYKDAAATSHRAVHNQTMSLGTALAYTLGTTGGTAVLKNFVAGKFAARTDGETLTNVTTTSGTLSGVLVGTSQITGGTLANSYVGTPNISGGTIASSTLNNVTLGTPDISGGTISSVLLGTSQITGGTATSITLGSPTITGTVNGTTVFANFPEAAGTPSSNDQLANKQYVDENITSQDLDVASDSGTIAIDLDSQLLELSGGTGIDTSASGTTVTLAIDSTVATLTGTQTLENKTIGTAQITGGTVANATIGTPSISNGTLTSSVINSATIGTPSITGGTASTITLGTPSITGGSISNAALIGTSQITGGTASGLTLTTASMTSGTISGVLLGTAQVTGGTVAGAVMTGASMTSGTLSGVLLGTSQVTGGTVDKPIIILNQGTVPVVSAEGDIRWDTDNDQIKIGDGSGSKVFSDDSVNASTYTKISGGTLNSGVIGTSAITGGTVAGAVMTGASMTSGTLSGVLVGTSQITGGTVASAVMTGASMTSGTLSGVLVGTSQITGGTANNIILGTPTLTLGSDADYDIFYRSAGGTVTRLASGTAAEGKYLKSGGTAAAPSWDTPTGAGDMGTATYDPAGIAEQLVGITASQTISTKLINGGTIANAVLIGTSQITGGTVNNAVLGTPTVTLGSDATGDIFYRSAGGTVTRLAIGTANQYLTTNGTTPSWGTVAASSGANYASMNDQALINGNFDVWQRNTTFTQNDDLYIADRWNALQEANSSWNFARSTDVPTVDSAYSLLGTCVTANNQAGIVQIIESVDSLKLTGGTVSLSFWAKTSAAAIANLRAAVLSWSSTADTVTSDVVATWNSDGTTPTWATNWTAENTPSDLALTTSWQQFKIENVAIDTASTNNIAVVIWVDDGTIAQGDAFYVTQVKLNRGATATTFNPLTFDEELQKCIRFYHKTYPYAIVPGAGTPDYIGSNIGYAKTTSAIYAMVRYSRMRTTPTIVVYHQDGTINAVYQINDASKDTVTGVSFESDVGYWQVSASATLTAGEWYYWHHTASAEL